MASLLTAGVLALPSCVNEAPGALPSIGGDGGPDTGQPDAIAPGSDSGPFSMKNIPDLVLWLRADTGVEFDGDSTNVVTWRDQSGHTNDFSQALSSARPNRVAVGDAGEQAIDFENQLLTNGSPLGIGAGAARTFLAVARLKSTSKASPLLAQTEPTNGGNDLYSIYANTNPNAGWFGVDVSRCPLDSSQLSSTGSFGVHAFRAQPIVKNDTIAPKLNYRFNGFPLSLTKNVSAGDTTASVTPNPTETTLGALRIYQGDGGSATTIYGAWVIEEVAVYARALTDAEITSAENDLKSRHSL